MGGLTSVLALGLKKLGVKVRHAQVFDTLRVDGTSAEVKAWLAAAAARRINLRPLGTESLTIALDETTAAEDVRALWEVFAGGKGVTFTPSDLAAEAQTQDGSRFTTLLGGNVGVGGLYDWWRWLMALLTGRKFARGHAKGVRLESDPLGPTGTGEAS